jgi:hypothetical protein
MTVPAGFTGLSFQCASLYDATRTVCDGPDGTDAVLASLVVPRTGGGSADLPCGDPTGVYGKWNRLTVPFSGVARSVRFIGAVYNMVIDDVTIVQGPPPRRAPRRRTG